METQPAPRANQHTWFSVLFDSVNPLILTKDEFKATFDLSDHDLVYIVCDSFVDIYKIYPKIFASLQGRPIPIIFQYKNPLHYSRFWRSFFDVITNFKFLIGQKEKIVPRLNLKKYNDNVYSNRNLKWFDEQLPRILGVTKLYKKLASQFFPFTYCMHTEELLVYATSEIRLAKRLDFESTKIRHVFLQSGQVSLWLNKNNKLKILQITMNRPRFLRMRNMEAVLKSLPVFFLKSHNLDEWDFENFGNRATLLRNFSPGVMYDNSTIDRESKINLLLDEMKLCYEFTPISSTFEPLLATISPYSNSNKSFLTPVLPGEFFTVVEKLSQMLPSVLHFQHGDVTENNILISNSNLILIDWEWCCWTQAIGFDFFNFFLPQSRSKSTGYYFWKTLLEDGMQDKDSFNLKQHFIKIWPVSSWSEAIFSFWALRMARNLYFGGEWKQAVLEPSVKLLCKYFNDA